MFLARSLLIAVVVASSAVSAQAASVQLAYSATVTNILERDDVTNVPSFGSAVSIGDTVTGVFELEMSSSFDTVATLGGDTSRFVNAGSASASTPDDSFLLNNANIFLNNDNSEFGDRFQLRVQNFIGSDSVSARFIDVNLRDSTGAAFDTQDMLPTQLDLDLFDTKMIVIDYISFNDQNQRLGFRRVAMTLQELSAVPLPASILLLAMPVLGLFGFARRRQRAV